MQQNTRHPIVCLILLLSLWRNSNSTASPSGMTHNIQRLEGLDDKLFGQNEMRTYLILSKNLGSNSPSYNLAPRHQTLHCLLIGKCVVESEDWLIDWLKEVFLPPIQSWGHVMVVEVMGWVLVALPCLLLPSVGLGCWCPVGCGVCASDLLLDSSRLTRLLRFFVIVYSVSQLFVCLFVCF